MNQQNEKNEPLDPMALLDTLSQDIYLIRNDQQTINIQHSIYKNAPKIEWEYNDEDKSIHYCFLTENGYQPLNLIGPILTKVIQWNIDSAKLPPEHKDLQLQPGYLLDLRGLHLARLRHLSVNQGSKQYLSLPTHQQHDLNTSSNAKPYDGWVPEQFTAQLAAPVKDNLYIVSWKDPLALHSQVNNEDFQINYLSIAELDQCPVVEDSGGSQVKKYLKSYFEQAGVQIGTLNPIDIYAPTTKKALADSKDEGIDKGIIINEIAITCYVANLTNFSK